MFKEKVEIVEADVMIYQRLVEALYGIDVAFYLIHSMEKYPQKNGRNLHKKMRKAARTLQELTTE